MVVGRGSAGDLIAGHLDAVIFGGGSGCGFWFETTAAPSRYPTNNR